MKRVRAFAGNIWSVFAVAAILHVAVVLVAGRYNNPMGLESTALAGTLYEGKGFSLQAKSERIHYTPERIEAAQERVRQGDPAAYAVFHPTSRVAPGYPYFLFLMWKVLGRNGVAFLAIGVAQALLVSSVVFPLRWVTDRWFGREAGVCASWIACLMPLYALYPTRYFPVSVFIAWHPWLLFGWLKLKDRITVRRSGLIGAITGLGGLFQPLLLGLYGVMGAGLLSMNLVRGEWRKALTLLIVPLAVLAVLTPWTIRNCQVHGRFIPIRASAMPFWIGNNLRATGVEDAGGGKSLYVTFPPKCVAMGTELTEVEYDDILYQEAWGYIRSDLPGFARRTLKKVLWYWTAVPLGYKQGDGMSSNTLCRILHAAYWLLFLGIAMGTRIAAGKFPAEYILLLSVYVLFCSAVYGLLHIENARMRSEIEFILIPAVARGIVLLRQKIWSTQS